MSIESIPRTGALGPFIRMFGESRTWIDGRPLWPLLSNVRHYPSYAGMLRPNTPSGAHAYYRVMTRLFAREHAERALLGRRLTAGVGARIDPRQGYLLQDHSDHPAVRGALARCDEIRAGADFDAVLQQHGRPALRTYPLNQDDAANAPIFRLVTDPVLLAPISDYLGGIPVLQAAAISYSPNREWHGQSQHFHLDRDDYRQIKGNLYLEDIDADSGPLTILPADRSRRVFDRLSREDKIRHRGSYQGDAGIMSAAGGDKVVPLCGPRGSIALVDTCNCFHCGSRPASKPRLSLYLHYVSAFAVSLPLWGRRLREPALLRGESAEADRIQTLVLGLTHLCRQHVRSRRYAAPAAA